MKYFKMQMSSQQLNQGLFANFSDEDKWGNLPWINGDPIDQEISLPVQYIITKQRKSKKFFPEKLEYFGTGHGEILIHDRTKKIFEPLTKNHTMYTSEIEYQGKKLVGPFYTMNLEVLYPAADLTKSDCYKSKIDEEEYILSIDHLILSAQKLAQVPKDEHLFRLQEFTPVTIIDEYGKNLIEEAGVVGVEFQELEVAE